MATVPPRHARTGPAGNVPDGDSVPVRFSLGDVGSDAQLVLEAEPTGYRLLVKHEGHGLYSMERDDAVGGASRGVPADDVVDAMLAKARPAILAAVLALQREA